LAVLDGLEDLGLAGLGGRFFFQHGRRPGVEVPAVEVEAFDAVQIGQGLLLDLQEAEDDIHDLDARVVDVVLRFNRFTLEAQAAD